MSEVSDALELGFDEFLTFEGQGARNTYLKWRKDKVVDVWLSCLVLPARLWRHPTPKVVEQRSGENAGRTTLWSGNYNCLEDEKPVLLSQNMRNKLTGRRDYPPCVCPDCLFNEYIFGEVQSGRMHWLQPVLQFESDDETRIIRAGGLWNMYGSRKLTDAQKGEMRKHKVNPMEAWREDNKAKLAWLFVVARNDKLEDGLQIAVESNLLGQKVIDQLKKEVEKRGPQDGNPLKNPYPLRWKYNDTQGIQFDKRYDCVAAPHGINLTDEIEYLIRETEPPNLDVFKRKPNLEELRTSLESAAMVDGIPWDDLFGPAYDLYEKNGWPIGAQEESAPEEVVEEPAPPPPAPRVARRPPEVSTAPAPRAATRPAAAPRAAAPATRPAASRPAAAPAAKPAPAPRAAPTRASGRPTAAPIARPAAGRLPKPPTDDDFAEDVKTTAGAGTDDWGVDSPTTEDGVPWD